MLEHSAKRFSTACYQHWIKNYKRIVCIKYDERIVMQFTVDEFDTIKGNYNYNGEKNAMINTMISAEICSPVGR